MATVTASNTEKGTAGGTDTPDVPLLLTFHCLNPNQSHMTERALVMNMHPYLKVAPKVHTRTEKSREHMGWINRE